MNQEENAFWMEHSLGSHPALPTAGPFFLHLSLPICKVGMPGYNRVAPRALCTRVYLVLTMLLNKGAGI